MFSTAGHGVIVFIAVWPMLAGQVNAVEMVETRCCVAEIKRTADGKIHRRADVLRAFRDLYPCPATGQKRGRCPGWQMDHTIPLACGGFDSVSNLQWLPVEIKTCAGLLCKDRFERRVYCSAP